MRVVFWGTPEFAAPSLRALVGEGHEVVGVVTQPDRPAGRGRKLTPSPIRRIAEVEGIPVLTPDRPKGEPFMTELRALDPEISVVVAYGHILRAEVLDLPPRGSINVHASLLPELRGAAPINWAILRGHEETGVTIMQMDEGMDSGPILLQRPLPIGPDDTASGLFLKLSELGAEALIEALARLALDLGAAQEQDGDRATYAPKLDREMARISWSAAAQEISWHIRGMDSVPGAWSMLKGEPVKLFSPVPLGKGVPQGEEVPPEERVPPGEPMRLGEGVPRVEPVPMVEPAPPGEWQESGDPAGDSEQVRTAPGTVISTDPDRGIEVAAGVGSVLIREVQPPGKRRMAAGDWLRGGGPQPGDRFDKEPPQG